MKIISQSPRETLHLGRSLALRLQRGDVVCLSGQLGSGKTVLAKGIASGLGVKTARVVSPTFVLLREYARARIPLYHFDFYRLACAGDIAGLGYEEYFYGDGITVIEWPDRLQHLLPRDYLQVSLFILGPSRRSLDFKASGKRYREFLGRLYEDIRH
jgi:tRNA threonylcarbamoyladenosine biosynthesis protein TsaE